MPKPRNKVFVSYSHKDREWLRRLTTHLKPLIRDNNIDLWDDTKIKPGSRWKDEIQKAISEASVAILLVSAEFLASDFISENELPPLLAKARSEGATILPLIISPCRFYETRSIAQFQAINEPSVTLLGLQRVAQENILVEVSRVVEDAITRAIDHSDEIERTWKLERVNRNEKQSLVVQDAVIKVMGLGGGGSNTIAYIAQDYDEGIHLIAANTDNQALRGLERIKTIQLGPNTTRGLGAGGKLNIGYRAALESTKQIAEELEGSDLLFLTAGMGGGTGTGAISVVAEIAKKLDILTIAVVTKPFYFEGTPRMNAAEKGISELINKVDSLIVLPNDNLYKVVDSKVTLLQGFSTLEIKYF